MKYMVFHIILKEVWSSKDLQKGNVMKKRYSKNTKRIFSFLLVVVFTFGFVLSVFNLSAEAGNYEEEEFFEDIEIPEWDGTFPAKIFEVFSGERLQLAVAKTLEKNIEDEVSLEELENITDLSYFLSCTSLEGIQYLKNLEHISLEGQSSSELSVLSSLKNLKSFNIHILGDDDLSFLKDLTKLEDINIDCSTAKDINFLENLTGIKSLSFFNFTNLSDDFTPISRLTNLESLTVMLGSENYLNDIDFISNLEKLEDLRIYGNGITDISAVSKLTKLNYLTISSSMSGGNLFSNIDSIKSLTNLQYLELDNSKINNLEPLRNLINLESLSLIDNKIENIEPLSKLINLESLALSSNNVSDITPLAGLSKMVYLSLYNNSVYDFSTLTKDIISEAGEQEITLDSVYIGKGTITIKNPLKNFKDSSTKYITPVNISNDGIYNEKNNTITWTDVKLSDALTFEFKVVGERETEYGTYDKIYASGTVTVPLTNVKPNPPASDLNYTYAIITLISFSSLCLIYKSKKQFMNR